MGPPRGSGLRGLRVSLSEIEVVKALTARIHTSHRPSRSQYDSYIVYDRRDRQELERALLQMEAWSSSAVTTRVSKAAFSTTQNFVSSLSHPVHQPVPTSSREFQERAESFQRLLAGVQAGIDSLAAIAQLPHVVDDSELSAHLTSLALSLETQTASAKQTLADEREALDVHLEALQRHTEGVDIVFWAFVLAAYIGLLVAPFGIYAVRVLRGLNDYGTSGWGMAFFGSLAFGVPITIAIPDGEAQRTIGWFVAWCTAISLLGYSATGLLRF